MAGVPGSQREAAPGKARAEGDPRIRSSTLGFLKKGLKARREGVHPRPQIRRSPRHPGTFLCGSLDPAGSTAPPGPRPPRCEAAMELPRGPLLAVSNELDEAELAALKFLSRDHIPWGRLEAVRSPHGLFEALREKGFLEAGNLAFLRELLYCIGRIDLLVAHLGSSRQQVERELRAPGGARLLPLRWVRAGLGWLCRDSRHLLPAPGWRVRLQAVLGLVSSIYSGK